MIGRTGAALLALAFCLHAQISAAQQPASQPSLRIGRSVPHGTRSSEIMQMKVTVADLDRSLRFYREGIGLVSAVKAIDISSADNVAWRGNFREVPLNFTGSMAEAYFTLMQKKGEALTKDQARLVVIAIKVKSIAATLARLKQAGYAVGEAHELGPEFLISMVSDPDGYQVELIESPTMSPSPPG